jgi:hypothetical protein
MLLLCYDNGDEGSVEASSETYKGRAGRCFLEKEIKTVGRSSNGRGGKDKVLLFIGLGKGKRKRQVISVGRDEHGRGTKRFVWTVEQEKKGA